jgi:hypothetical protein
MTTIAPPTTWAVLETALRQRRPVPVVYHGHQRLLCPHALGWNNNRPMLLGYQTGGHTTTGVLPADPRKRWRCLYIDEIEQVLPAEAASGWATADNYNPAHPFPTIDTLTIAIPHPPATPPLGTTRRQPKHHR